MKIAKTVIWRKNEVGNIVLLNMANDNMFEINGLAADVWVKLTDGKPTEKIISEISKKNNFTMDSVSKHVSQFISDLKRKKILQ